MASKATAEPAPLHEICHLCQLPTPGSAKHAHENGIHHQAAKQLAAVALDRWICHMTAGSAADIVQDPEAADNVTFCEICTETIPSPAYSKHLTSRSHLVSALDDQVFEELVKEYVDEEDLKLLEAPTVESDGTSEKNDDKTTYKCHICALQIPSSFKSEHERSVHHRTRVALATSAARRTSAFLHNQTPIGVTKRNIKMTELLKSYTGTDLSKKPVEDEEVTEKEVQEKSSQVEIKKRLTAKQYFTDILPYLQYTETLYTIIVDDTEYVTIKNTNGTCMQIHIANFNGVYSDSSDVNYEMKCKMCNGYNQYLTYSSEKDQDKLHVMCLGHIRHVLTPLDNVHGIRKLDNSQALCVICNVLLHDQAIEHHIFNDIHHTAALAEALKRGRAFKETKNDLKIIIYTSPPVDKVNYIRNPVRYFPHNNVGFGVSYPQGGVSRPQVGLFGVQSQGANFSNTGSAETFGSGQAKPTFGVETASNFGSGSGTTTASGGFGSAASTGTAFGSAASNGTAFGSAASTGTAFGSAASTGPAFGSAPANTGPFGSNRASTGFASNSAKTLSFGVPASNDGANTASSFSFGIKPNAGTFGAHNPSTDSASIGTAKPHSESNTGGLFSVSAPFGTGTTNNDSNFTGTSSKETSIHLETTTEETEDTPKARSIFGV